MPVLIVLGLLSLILSLLVTPLCRNLFLSLGIVDRPDNDRKIHGQPIPRVGGLAIAISYAGALLLLLTAASHGFGITVQHRHLMVTLGPAVLVVFLTGLLDDLWTLRPWQKLCGQFAAAALAVAAGVRINMFDGHEPTNLLAIPVTVIWLVGYSNAFNLIDGMDGLAAGVGLLASVTTLLAAALHGDIGLATATVPLVGCLLGFLFYNFNPASVFLGDSGSLSVGFLLGCFGVIWSQKSAALVGLIAPLMALALPVMDTCLAIGRRLLRNKPIFSPDRGHIHHRLLARGLHPRSAALVLYAVCGAAAALSLVENSFSHNLGGLCIISFCALSWFGVKQLRYIEFRAASSVVRSGKILQLFQHEIYLHGLRDLLVKAETLRDCWPVVRSTCQELQSASVEFQFDDYHFREHFEGVGATSLLEFALPLGDRGRIRVTRSAAKSNPACYFAALCALQEGLQNKAALDESGSGETTEQLLEERPTYSPSETTFPNAVRPKERVTSA